MSELTFRDLKKYYNKQIKSLRSDEVMKIIITQKEKDLIRKFVGK